MGDWDFAVVEIVTFVVFKKLDLALKTNTRSNQLMWEYIWF